MGTDIPRRTFVAAYDLSLTRPAGCINGRLEVLNTTKLRGHERLAAIANWVSTTSADAALVAIEGYAYGRANQAHQLGELGGIVRHMLWTSSRPYIEVPPTSVKKYATGKGNAKKDDVIDAAYRRGGHLYTGSSNDEADAFFLWTLVCDLIGEPVLDMPANHRSALDKLTVPTHVSDVA